MYDHSAVILRRLELRDEAPFLQAVKAWDGNPGFVFAMGYAEGMSFAKYLDLLAANERGERLPPGFVPATFLTAFVGDQVVGRLSIRHELNEFLFRVGGHIGYGVLPLFRRRGYAQAMLAQALPFAKSVGISRALLTCDDDNLGSIRTIEHCGGVLENKVENGPNRPLKRRYWIELG